MARGKWVCGGVQRMTMSRAGSARKGSVEVKWVTPVVEAGWSAGAELDGVGVRWRMESGVGVSIIGMVRREGEKGLRS